MARAKLRGRQRWRSTAGVSVCVSCAALSAEVARSDGGRRPTAWRTSHRFRMPAAWPRPSARTAQSTWATPSSRTSGRTAAAAPPAISRPMDGSSRHGTCGRALRPLRATIPFSHQRRRELPSAQRLDGRGAAPGLQPATPQRVDPHSTESACGRRVRRRGRGQPLWLLEARRDIRLPPPVAEHQLAVPQHADVGRPRLAQGRSGQSQTARRGYGPAGNQCDGRPRPGPEAPHRRPDEADRGFRAGAVHCASYRRQGRGAGPGRGSGGPCTSQGRSSS